MEWQPISNAPMDGSYVIAFTDFGDFVLAYWSGQLQQWVGDGYTCRPTHWIRLPEPPK